MKALRLLVFGAIAFTASISASYAGPCSEAISKMEVRINTVLQAKAAAGPTGRQGVGAEMHVQPTPRSIGAAEVALDEVSPKMFDTVRQAMELARAADGVGDKNACEQALANAQSALGPLEAALPRR